MAESSSIPGDSGTGMTSAALAGVDLRVIELAGPYRSCRNLLGVTGHASGHLVLRTVFMIENSARPGDSRIGRFIRMAEHAIGVSVKSTAVDEKIFCCPRRNQR